jgi:hypothetical protein
MPADGTREDIRMSRRFWTCTMIVLFAFAAGCKKQENDQDAIRASIDKHLSGVAGLNMSVMDREVKQITVNGDHANAQVEFRLKQGSATMQVDYTLERQGAEWNVVGNQPSGGQNPHSGTGMPPPGSPGAGSGSMPQGHPPVN